MLHRLARCKRFSSKMYRSQDVVSPSSLHPHNGVFSRGEDYLDSHDPSPARRPLQREKNEILDFEVAGPDRPLRVGARLPAHILHRRD